MVNSSAGPPDAPRSRVYVVDDDDGILRCVARILRGAGYEVETFSRPREFLARARIVHPCCVLLDVQMPEMSGLDLQAELSQQEPAPQIVFLSGYASVPASVRAMKAGAVDYLPKPFENADLLAAVAAAVERSAEVARRAEAAGAARARLATLTPREREVFRGLVRGLRSRAIADELGTAVKTVDIHRGRVMSKLRCSSVVELVRLAELAEDPRRES